MCLLFLSYKESQEYPLIIAANRDEFLDRPTASLDFWDEEQKILAGKDLQGGGTWLGVASDLRFGAITNYRDGRRLAKNGPSRGEIILQFLEDRKNAKEFMDELASVSSQYDGFNLILGNPDGLYYHSNQQEGVKELSPGFYGLSNHLLDTPWPKIRKGKSMLSSLMTGVQEVDRNSIFEALRDTRSAMDADLPDTGVGIMWERLLSSIFINSPNYGTRSSAIITVNHKGQVTFSEKSYLRMQNGQVEQQLVQKGFYV